MHRNTIFLLLFLFLLGIELPAQQLDKVSILPVKYTTYREGVATQVANLLYDELVSSKRVEVFPASYFDDLLDKTYQEQGSDQIDDQVIERAKQDNTNYLLSARIASCKVERKRDEEDNDYNYTCTMNVGLRLIDVNTLQTKRSYSLKYTPFITIRWNTEGQAVSQAIKGLNKDFKEFIDEVWPVEGKVLQISETNSRGEAIEIILNIGTEDGVNRHDKLKVVEKKSIGDQVYNDEVGEIQIIAVNGPKLSTGKVRKGREDITNKFEQGVNLSVVTKND